MRKKYEFTGETKVVFGVTLRQIRVITAFNYAAAGTVGGWIAAESNLAHDGNAWVSGNARVSGDARVSDNARVSGNAQVYGNARVSDNARVSGNALVYGNARVSDNARVYGNALVYGNARVSDNARVSGNAQVYGNAQVSPVVIMGLTWTVTIADQQMTIGCQSHDITEWEAFEDWQIEAMDGKALKWWQANKAPLFAIIKASGRPFAKASEAAQ